MPNIRELNGKVESLRNMQKVMRAMNMIASTKLRRIVSRLPAMLTFEQGALEMARDLALTCHESNDPLINPGPTVGRACIVLFTADKGLCGSHNNSVQRAAAALMESLKIHDAEVDAVCIGSRGATFCRRNSYPVFLSVESGERVLAMEALRDIAGKLVARLVAGEVQQVFLVYNVFASTLQQTARTQQVLPLSSLLPADMPLPPPEFTFESGNASPRDSVVTVLFFLLQAALRHSRLSEHASRMTAMDNATNNSEDLISRYGAIRNRARQTRITNDLTEIVAGKEAMKD